MLSSRNTGKGVHARIEHFQNQFILQKEVIDQLKHDLNISERQVASFAQELSAEGIESIKMDNHVRLWDLFNTFRKIFKELKTEFRRFEAEWM
jgi:hypothetical protein